MTDSILERPADPRYREIIERAIDANKALYRCHRCGQVFIAGRLLGQSVTHCFRPARFLREL